MINDKIIVALDVAEKNELKNLLNQLSGTASFVKIGMELFYSLGPDVIKLVKGSGFKIFLDLKMHDIPNTVAKTAKTLAKLDVDMINFHAAGGGDMMEGACNAYRDYKSDGLLIAVTQLTSTSNNVLRNQIGIHQSMEQTIHSYAKLAKKSGANGVVCSAQEVTMIKKLLGSDFVCVTPGIRPKDSEKDDQVRVMTPTNAIELGSDYLVIGRPITQSGDPKEAYLKILEEIKIETSC